MRRPWTGLGPGLIRPECEDCTEVISPLTHAATLAVHVDLSDRFHKSLAAAALAQGPVRLDQPKAADVLGIGDRRPGRAGGVAAELVAVEFPLQDVTDIGGQKDSQPLVPSFLETAGLVVLRNPDFTDIKCASLERGLVRACCWISAMHFHKVNGSRSPS